MSQNHTKCSNGRSMRVLYAIIIALGIANDWKSAENMVQEKRPFINMNSLYEKTLKNGLNIDFLHQTMENP